MILMATVTQEIFICDVCGNANDVQRWAFGFDGKRYEIDLCPKDGNGLSKVVARYASKARKVTARKNQSRNGDRPRSPRAAAATDDAASAPGTKRPPRRRVTSSTQEKAKASRPRQQAAKASGMQQEKSIYVYGILPADIEVAAEMQGVGEHPGPLGIVCSDGLAALISEVGMPGRLGSPRDLRTYREILDSTAIEVPVLPLRFGTVFTGEGAVADELLAPR